MWVVVFSGGVPGAGGAGPAGDESEAAHEGQSVGEGCAAGEDMHSVFSLPRKGTFQADVPRLPVCYLRTGSADGRGECSHIVVIADLHLHMM